MNIKPSSTSPFHFQQKRNRILLGLIFALFFGSMGLAAILRLSGWTPQINRNHGQLLQPPLDWRNAPLLLANGDPWQWNPAARRWRIVLAPAPDCVAKCVALAQSLHTVWQLLGHRADHVEILWLGRLPSEVMHFPALHVLQIDSNTRVQLPAVDDPTGTPIYVIDPNGFVVLRYAPAFDPLDLRADLVKLLKLK